MIKIEGLSKFFRTEEVETIALNGVSMEVKDGEFVAIMGPGPVGQPDIGRLLPGGQGSRTLERKRTYAGA